MMKRWKLSVSLLIALQTLAGCGALDAAIKNFYSGAAVTLSSAPQNSLSFKGGTQITFTWAVHKSALANETMFVETSFDSGQTWILSATASLIDRAISIDLPELSTESLKIRLRYSDAGKDIFLYESTNLIVDSLAPTVQMLTFDSGGVFAGGSSQNITWSAEDLSFDEKPANIFYSLDKNTWNQIQGPKSANGKISWVLPTIDTHQAWIKVFAMDMHGLSSEIISDVPFAIDSQKPLLSLSEPKAGDIWNPLSFNDIFYQATDTHLTNSSLTIEISTDGGITYSRIKENQLVSEKFRLTASDLSLFPDSNTVRLRLSVKDDAEHWSSVESATFTILRMTPQLTIEKMGVNFNNQNTYTFTGSCDLSAEMSNTDISITGPLLSQTIACTGSAPTGIWTYTTPVFGTDDSRLFQFSQTNTLGVSTTKSSVWIRDTAAPTLNALSIESGASEIITPFVKIATVASDNNGLPLKIFLAEAETPTALCSADNAIEYSQTLAATLHDFNLTMNDSDKKVCAWVEDSAGNRSEMNLPTGDLGVNAAVISFKAGSPPVIQEFLAINPKNSSTKFSAGDPVAISWKITDTEGLTPSPVTLEYSIDGTSWKNVVKNHGSLTGNTTSYSGTYLGFVAPSSSFFLLRMVATDLSGNKSLRVTSNSMNTGNWSIFAGNPDPGIGGSSKSLSIPVANSTANSIAIHPLTGEIFISSNHGIISINPLTSTSKLIATGTDNLPWLASGLSDTGGAFTNLTVGRYLLSIQFDSAGRLYVNTSLVAGASNPTRIYQIDLQNRTSRLYAGGGTNSNPTTSLEAIAEYGPLAFDEENSMYFAVPCSTNLPESKRKLYKLSQQANGLPGNLSLVAGNCIGTTPANNVSALASSFAYGTFYNYGAIFVKDLGNTIYYNNFSAATYKIIQGTHYHTGILGTGSRGLAYNKNENTLYVVHNNATYGTIHKWKNIGLKQSGGEVSDGKILPSGISDSGCDNDDLAALSSCPNVDLAVTFNKNNLLLWLDGLRINTPGAIRLRYLDNNQKIQTLAGTKSFFGDGMHKTVLRSSEGIGSIFFKSTTEPGSLWTPGLYFADSTSLVFGRINPTDTTEVLWGNQINGTTDLIPEGTLVSPSQKMGYRYSLNGGIFTFDSTGLPWLRVSNRILSLDSTGRIHNRQTGSNGGLWHTAPVGSSPAATAVHPYGLNQNYAIKKDRYVFLMGGYYSVLNIEADAPVLRVFDFTGNTISHILGGPGGRLGAPDSLTPTDLTNKNLSSLCTNHRCSLHFQENDPSIDTDDVLYFTEGFKIRRITNPLNAGAQTLETLLEVQADLFPLFNEYNTITNLFITPDARRMFYIVSDKLYCHNLSAQPSSWCNNTSLGYPDQLGALPWRPNQMTMMGNDTLLINNRKIILQFKLPQD